MASRSTRKTIPVANSPARIEERAKKVDDGAGGLVDQKIKFPIWFEPVANGGTPMCQALTKGRSIVQEWLQRHTGCFPPVVINITDGESTDGDPLANAESLQSLNSSDGNVLFFNIHISSQKAAPIEFPDSDSALPDQFAKLLFKMSSVLQQDRAESLRQIREHHIAAYLHNHSISDAVLQGIGAKLKARLQAAGIRSAADAAPWQVRSVHGIGDARASEVVNWAATVRRQAEMSAPTWLPQVTSQQIADKYQSTQRSLEYQIEAFRRRNAAEKQSIMDEFAGRGHDLRTKRVRKERRRDWCKSCFQ